MGESRPPGLWWNDDGVDTVLDVSMGVLRPVRHPHTSDLRQLLGVVRLEDE